MLISLCYLVLRHVLRLAVLGCRSHDFKALEIVVLQHELGILRRQTTRPAMTTVDRLFLTAASRPGQASAALCYLNSDKSMHSPMCT